MREQGGVCTAFSRRALCGVAAWLLNLLSASPLYAERLPFTTYTTAQGLAGNDAVAAVEDAQGFLWVGGERGLSRFDGREFRVFGKEQGLDRSNVASLAIAEDGAIWVGVWTAAYRFDLSHGGSFIEVPFEGRTRPLEGMLLASDKAGHMWAGFDGLYKAQRTRDGEYRFRRVALAPDVSLPFVSVLFVDRDGSLWAGYNKLYRILPDGRVVHVSLDHPASDLGFSALAQDADGRIWAGTNYGLWVADHCNPSEDGDGDGCALHQATSIPINHWNGLVSREGGGVWMGTHRGILEIDGRAEVVRTITREHGLTGAWPIVLDRAGDLWIGSGGTGLQRLAADGFTSFGRADGLEAPEIRGIVKSRTGELVAVGTPHVLQRYDGRRFVATQPMLPPDIRSLGWGWQQADMQDRMGRWWIPTDDGLVGFAPVTALDELTRARAPAVYHRSGCFRGLSVFRLYEDSRGDIWIATAERDQPTLHRWNRASDTFDCFQSSAFLGGNPAPTAFLDDARGTLWIGFYDGRVVRYHHSRFECVFNCGTGSQGLINGLLLDRRGRLWIATARSGVLRVDDPGGQSPRSTRLTTANGLWSDAIVGILEDRFGRIYIATENGVDIIDEANNKIHHYGAEEGLPDAYITVAGSSPDGDLWFGSFNGLARFTPPARFRETPPPRVLIDAVRLGSAQQPVSAAGESRLDAIIVPPDQRSVQIDFVGLPRRTSRTLRFQYRLLEGDWSVPSRNPSILLASLSPGSYGFEIRALDGAGVASPHSAIVRLRVLAPIYRRPWFLSLTALFAAAVAFAIYRFRVSQLLHVERVRARIATDLHDDIGSGLSQVAILSEVVRQRIGADGNDAAVAAPLSRIAETSRDLVDAMDDIVWAINPERDTLSDLVHHMRRFAQDMLGASDTELVFTAPEKLEELTLGPDLRREVFLILKESVTNIVKHAACGMVRIDFAADRHQLRLQITDDGRGFDTAADTDGDGLASMRRRVQALGGRLQVRSTPGCGTFVTLDINLKRVQRAGRYKRA